MDTDNKMTENISPEKEIKKTNFKNNIAQEDPRIKFLTLRRKMLVGQ